MMMNSNKSAAGVVRSGFTLIELLVTIAIIAVLISLLLPALGRVQTSARIASTRSILTNFLNASDSFQVDEKRAPGHFSQTQMGTAENGAVASGGPIGLTNMENALIDLAGGVIPESDPLFNIVPSSQNSIRLVAPYLAGNGILKIDTDSVGNGEFGGGYFSDSDGRLSRVEGQFGASTGTGELSPKQMPDLLDHWGQPIMLWLRDEGARGAPPSDPAIVTYFANDVSDSPVPGAGRSLFYWATNAGYLKSDALGEDMRSQKSLSILGSDAANGTLENVLRAMQAVMGSPAFPVEKATVTDQWRPAKPRGSIVATSAGPDQIFFRKGNPEVAADEKNLLFYAPSQGAATVGGGTDIARSIESFDDLIASTGG